MKAVIFTSACLLAILPKPAIAQACVQATQRIQVPQQIHLIKACQIPPVPQPTFKFVTSKDGIDLYSVQWPSPVDTSRVRWKEYQKTETPAQRAWDKNNGQVGFMQDDPGPVRYPFSVTGLLVFQDEAEREAQVNQLMNAGEAITWLRGGYRSDSTLPADWTPVFSIKYAIYTFTILSDNNILLREAYYYAPIECYTYNTSCDDTPNPNPSSLQTSEIAIYSNISPPPLHRGSLEYRFALMLMREKYPTPPDVGASFSRYVEYIKRTVALNWYSQLADPVASMGHSVVISFVVHRDGEVSDVRVAKSSGVPSLDFSAIQAVERVNSFYPLPAGYPGSSAPVSYTFTYDQNTVAKKSK